MEIHWFLIISINLILICVSHGYPSSKEVSGSDSGEKLGLIDSDVDLVKIETEFRSTIIPAPTNSAFETDSTLAQFTEVTDDGQTVETIAPTQDSFQTTDNDGISTVQVLKPGIDIEAPVHVDLDDVSSDSSLLSLTTSDTGSTDEQSLDSAIAVTLPSETSQTLTPDKKDSDGDLEISPKIERESDPGNSEGEKLEDPQQQQNQVNEPGSNSNLEEKTEKVSELPSTTSDQKSDIIEKTDDHKPHFEDTNVNNKTGNANVDAEVVPGQELIKHGATYYIKNVLEDVVLTAHKHKFLPIGLLPGVVTTEDFSRQNSQTWDAILGQAGPEETEEKGFRNHAGSTFWFLPLSYSLNTVSILNGPTGSPLPLKNSLHVVPTQSGERKGQSSFLLRSDPLQKCIQNEGIHRPIVYAPCDPTLPSQQWTAEFLYEDRKALAL